MAFSEIKKQVIYCLKNNHISHEQRANIDIKNLLSTGEISLEKTIKILSRCRGNEYSTSKHHSAPSIDVHIVKTRYMSKNWYLKWYFLEPDCIFISVHESEV